MVINLLFLQEGRELLVSPHQEYELSMSEDEECASESTQYSVRECQQSAVYRIDRGSAGGGKRGGYKPYSGEGYQLQGIEREVMTQSCLE